MFYTVVPMEELLEGFGEDPPSTTELTMGGITLEVEMLGNFQARVVRVLSTDPSHYLQPHFQPGAIISREIV